MSLTLRQKEEELNVFLQDQEHLKEEHESLMQTTLTLKQRYNLQKDQLSKSTKKLKKQRRELEKSQKREQEDLSVFQTLIEGSSNLLKSSHSRKSLVTSPSFQRRSCISPRTQRSGTNQDILNEISNLLKWTSKGNNEKLLVASPSVNQIQSKENMQLR